MRWMVLGMLLLMPAAALADQYDDIWIVAEARVIAERCPHSQIDERVMAGIIDRSHIDLKENADDRQLYRWRRQERSDQFWPRSAREICMRGWIGYGPHGIDVKNLLIFEPLPRQ